MPQGSPLTYRFFTSKLALETQMPVFALDYPLCSSFFPPLFLLGLMGEHCSGPETALTDVVSKTADAYAWLVNSCGYNPSEIRCVGSRLSLGSISSKNFSFMLFVNRRFCWRWSVFTVHDYGSGSSPQSPASQTLCC